METQNFYLTPPATTWRRLLAAAALTAASLSHAGAAHEAPAMVDSWAMPASKSAVVEADNGRFRQRATRVLPAPVAITLDALPAEAVAQKSAARAGGPLQIGVSRKVALTKDAPATAGLLGWQSLPDGSQAAAISFTSQDALSIRIGLHVEQIPPGTTLRVYAQGGETELEIPGNEVLLAIQRNINADGDTAQARTYWLPPVAGSEATLEIEIAPGISTEAVVVSMPMISHQYDARENAIQRASGRCNVDVMCSSGYEADRTSVAHIEYQEPDGWYICSGTLLNNAANDGTPYFLTANHCIDSQTVASTMNSYWFYWSNSCNSSALNPGVTQLTGGATLLWNERHSDTTLLQLNRSAPAGATFQGWLADEVVARNATVSGLHHPSGDMQKVSSGMISSYDYCEDAGNGYFSCRMNVAVTDSNRYGVQWLSGTTEGGSSGSALLYQKNGSRYLIGVLNSGSASCSNRTALDHYGRFDQAYKNGNLARWLYPAVASDSDRIPVFRFFNTATGAHFFTHSTSERNAVIANLPTFNYEGVAFYAQPSQVSGSSPVFRFFNTIAGAHFYTISEAEAQNIRASLPTFSYEGPAWYGRTNAGDGSSPLYRFYLAEKGIHFYTISEAEAQSIRANLPQYHYEGVGYYVWTSQ